MLSVIKTHLYQGNLEFKKRRQKNKGPENASQLVGLIAEELLSYESFSSYCEQYALKKLSTLNLNDKEDLNDAIKKVAMQFVWTEITLGVVEGIPTKDLPLSHSNVLFELKNEPILFPRFDKDGNAIEIKLDPLIKRKMRILSLYHKPTSSPYLWGELVDQYLDAPEGFKLFEEVEGRLIRNDALTIWLDREVEYEEVFEFLIHKSPNYLKHFNSGTGEEVIYYVKRGKDSDGKLLEKRHFIAATDLANQASQRFNPNWIIPSYRNKKRAIIPHNFDVATMLEEIRQPGKPPLPLMRFNFADKECVQLPINSTVHVLGGLGVGKSNFKFGMAKYFLEKQGIEHITIIEDKVATVLDVVRRYNSIGIKAVPIIGKDDEEHLANYLATLNPEDYENDEILGLLSGGCMALSCQKDWETPLKDAPCNNFMQENPRRKIHCPFISSCGRAKRYRELATAQVWVTTISGFATSRIPNAFNPTNRTLFELIYDRSDIVFMDEIDGTQAKLDEVLLSQNALIRGFELSHDLKTLRQALETNTEEDVTSRLLVYLNEFDKAKIHFNKLLHNCNDLSAKLNNSMLTLRKVFNLIISSTTTTSDSFAFKKELEELMNTANIHFMTPHREIEIDLILKNSSLYQAYKNIAREYEKGAKNHQYKEYEAFIIEAKKYCKSLSVEMDASLGDLPFQLIVFFIVLMELDRLYKLIVTYCEELRGKNSPVIQGLYSLKLSQLPVSNYTYEPLIDMRYGYKIKQPEDSQKFDLDIYQYNGVGRQLIQSLTSIKDPLGQEGPAVIALSGTSCFPGSPHYNFDVKPHLLLESIDKYGNVLAEGSVTSKFIPMPRNLDFDRVSGVKGDKERRDVLRRLIQYLHKKKIIQQALRRKKALFVVGNKGDSEFVSDVLNGLGYDSIYLGDEESDCSITKSSVERLAFGKHSKAECLVVSIHSITRGYNILDEEGDSLFGTAFFLTRPYPQPESFIEALKITHSQYAEAVESILNGTKEYKDPISKEKTPIGYDLTDIRRFNELYKSCNFNFKKAYNMGRWKDLTHEQKIIVAAYAFVPIKQMAGRMQRNRNSCTIYFCDGAFCTWKDLKNLKDNKGDSMFDYWYRMLDSIIETTPFGESLYGEFYRSLSRMMDEMKLSKSQTEYTSVAE